MGTICRACAVAVLTLLVGDFAHAQAPAQQAQQQATAPPETEAWPPPGVYKLGPDVKPPRVLHEQKPYYPPQAMREKIEGTVIVECVVESDGSVKRVKVSRSLDKVYGLDDEAVRVVKQWRFAPGMRDGYAVPVLVTIELTFTMGKGRSGSWPRPWTRL